MPVVRRIIVSAFAALAFGFMPIAAAQSSEPSAAQIIVHTLDYVGVDYPEAVEGDKVKNEDEYKEMVEFTTQVVALLRTLPANPQRATLIADAEKLATMVQKKLPSEEIAAAAGRLRWAIIGAYKMAVAPTRVPDLRTGTKLYQTLCASCHGAGGRGDGPAATSLDPKPSNFHDTARMTQRSIYGLYNTITLGVAGTGMASFKHLSEDERWALAFYIANFPAAREEQARGEALWKAGKGGDMFPDIGNMATLSANEIRERYGEEAVAIQSYLRAHPEALMQGKPSPIAFSLQKLGEALAAYRRGERASAQQLAILAYIEGFELVEPSLHNVDSQLMLDVEREMAAFRNLLKSGAPFAEVEQQAAHIESLLKQAQERLSHGVSATMTFTSSLLILLREGLEAILVLAAIFAFVVKTHRRDALPYVHAGWIAALALGFATWFAATFLIDVSGANRETTEGVTALLAAAMLIYVGFWLHSRAYAQAWQRFIKEQVGAALEQRTLWAMAAVSFLAVYREMFEVVLFYQALWVQAGPQGQGALLGGLAVAAVVLVGLGWVMFKYSMRLPVGLFFAASSILLALLAVIFAGQGMAALQEAGAIPADGVNFIRVPALGIFPTVQSLGTQLVVLLIVAGAFYLASRNGRGQRAPG